MTIWRDDAGLNIQKSMKRGVKGTLLHGKRASFVLRKMPFANALVASGLAVCRWRRFVASPG